MAIVVLAHDLSADGEWQVDYDTVGLTVGHTVTQGTASGLTLTVIRVSDQAQFTKDVTADFGKGRVVDLSNVPNSEIPAHVKGQPYPFLFNGTWVHSSSGH
jgi:YD repeat-containing protein